jgi:hypothetical protein
MSIRRKLFYGFTLAVVTVLLLLPATGWLARMQMFPFLQQNVLRSLTHSALETGKAGEESTRFVATRSNDFDLQFAHAMNAGSDESLTRLEALDKKFPDNPAVIAARLTRLIAGQVRVGRREENLLSPVSKRPKEPVKPATPSDPATVAQFVALAEQGERVAPTNAFFPVMAAIGNFARHRDAEAAAAWKRAGAKPDWDDYTLLEMNAKWRLQIERNGGSEVGFLPRAASYTATLFPHYSAVRASARMATVKAFEAEQTGDSAEGIALRGATRHIGAAMMANSSTDIGALVGRAVTAIAGSRPGGAEPIDTGSYTQAEKDANRPQKDREAKYIAYLRSAEHPEEAAAFAAASRDGDAVKAIFKDGMERTYMGFGEKTFRLMACWYGCVLLLAGVLSSLMFAGIFKLIYKFSPRLQKSEPLQTSARWGVMLGLTLPCPAGLAALTGTEYWTDNSLEIWITPDVLCGAVFGIALLLLVVPPIACRLSGRSIGHGLLVLLGTVGTLALMGAVGAATWFMFAGPVGAASLLQGLSAAPPDGETTPMNTWAILLPMIISLVMLSLPVVLLAVFAGISRMLRVPVAAGVTRGMRAMAVPLACVLLLGWGVYLLATLKHENAAIAEMKRTGTIGEPRLQAEILAESTRQ